MKSLGNTGTRILVSLVAVPVILAACYYGEIPFLLFVLLIGLLSFYEFTRLTKNKDSNPNTAAGLISIFLLVSNAYFQFISFEILLLLISLLLLITELFRNKKSPIINLGSTFFGIFYLGLFFTSIIWLREYFGNSELEYYKGGSLIISILMGIWVCDSAAFFLGTAFGKHKLFPRVSPNKSWEGAIAGFIFSLISMSTAYFLILDFMSWTDIIIIGIIIGIAGQLGDLIESLLKRDSGIKDTSTLIPGHGGMFDRFDSLLLTVPTVYIYLFYFSSV